MDNAIKEKCYFCQGSGISSSTTNSKFDMDLRKGLEAEALVYRLLTANIETVEVKSDGRWKETGNVYVETRCWSHNLEQWYPSGINITKASHWVFELNGLVLIVDTNRLRLACAKHGRKTKCRIPPNFSEGFLITVDDLIRMSRGL